MIMVTIIYRYRSTLVKKQFQHLQSLIIWMKMLFHYLYIPTVATIYMDSFLGQ